MPDEKILSQNSPELEKETPSSNQKIAKPPMSFEKENKGEEIVMPELPQVNVPAQDPQDQSHVSSTTVVLTSDDPVGQTNIQVNQSVQESEGKDDDFLEKPWVKKAEEIIEKDKDEPFLEETDHENLEIDYLQKRFGKEVKKDVD